MRRAFLAIGLALVVALASCSSGDDAAPTTTGSTTTTIRELTPAEIKANIEKTSGPALAAAFDADTAACVLGVLQEAGTGELSADDLNQAYEDRCHVTASQVFGVITAAELVRRGAEPPKATCVSDFIGKLSVEAAESLDDPGLERVYVGCGIDPEGLAAG